MTAFEDISVIMITFCLGILLVMILGIYKLFNKLMPNFYPNVIATFVWMALLAIYPEIR
jgi:hypothetical protein